jgi:hypothetical protein
MPGLFEWLDGINTKTNLELDEDDPYKDYVPFQINNGMAQFLDTVLLANEMNKRPWLTKEMQFKFYHGAVTKKKRMGKWAKVEEVNKDDVEVVATHYGINHQTASVYLKLMKPEEFTALKKAGDTGGAEAKRGRKK